MDGFQLAMLAHSAARRLRYIQAAVVYGVTPGAEHLEDVLIALTVLPAQVLGGGTC